MGKPFTCCGAGHQLVACVVAQGVALVPGEGSTRSRAQVCVPQCCVQEARTTTFPTTDVQLPLPRVSHRKHVVVDPWSQASMNLKNCPVPASVSATGVLFKAS